MKSIRIVLIALGVLAVVAILRPRPQPVVTPSSPTSVQADVKACIESALAGDLNRTLSLMHSRLIAITGGVSESRRALDSIREKLATARLIEVRFPSPPTFLRGQQNEFAIMPVCKSSMLTAIKGKSQACTLAPGG